MPVHDAADCRAQNCHHHREPLVPRDAPHPDDQPSDPTRRSED